MKAAWSILAVLFFARATMAFQFQSVAAVAPIMSRSLGVDLADIGILIGLYLSPGILIAIPGGLAAHRLGDKRVVFLGFALMIIGGATMTFWTSWSGQWAGRFLSGSGGMLLNVLLTKMATDWFAGHRTATAMAIFINSWPAGIAASLLVLPAVAAVFELQGAFLAATLVAVAAFVIFATFYRPPGDFAVPATTARAIPKGRTLAAVIAAAVIWSLFNIGFATIFAFGPSMLAERGETLVAAGSMTSMVLWLASICGPVGGFLSDRLKRPYFILIASCVAFALLLILVARSTAVLPGFVAIGLICALPAGIIMSLPARVLEPSSRAIGMGVFYTVYYLGMMAGPALAGSYAEAIGTAAAAWDFGAAMLLACPLVLWIFHRLTYK